VTAPAAGKIPARAQPGRAIQARRRDAAAKAKAVEKALKTLGRTGAPITRAAVARLAGVSRSFTYENEAARAIVPEAQARSQARADGRTVTMTAQQEASWRERALNAEDQIRALRRDLDAERRLVADLIGQLREPDGTWIEHDRNRLRAENRQLLAERNQLLRERDGLQRKLDGAPRQHRPYQPAPGHRALPGRAGCQGPLTRMYLSLVVVGLCHGFGLLGELLEVRVAAGAGVGVACGLACELLEVRVAAGAGVGVACGLACEVDEVRVAADRKGDLLRVAGVRRLGAQRGRLAAACGEASKDHGRQQATARPAQVVNVQGEGLDIVVRAHLGLLSSVCCCHQRRRSTGVNSCSAVPFALAERPGAAGHARHEMGKRGSGM
jgi:hypothetical protein